MFASAGADGLIKIWKFEDGEFHEEDALEKHKGWVRSVCWGETLVSGGEDGTVVVWDHETAWKGKEIWNGKGCVWNITCNEYTSEIAISTSDNITRVLRQDEEKKWNVLYEISENGVLDH